jgi:uncharacterized protein YdaU (DUF1376 family)
MAKIQAKRMDWFKWYPRDIQTSLSYRMMTSEQRGAYRDLLDVCWINFPDVSFPMNKSMIQEVCNIRSDSAWEAIMPEVLAKFELRDGRLYNNRLRSQVDEALVDTENAKIRRLSGNKPTTEEPEIDCSQTGDFTTVVLQRDDKRREEKRREEEISTESVGDLLSTMNTEISASVIPYGKPGHFRRGQYPGTSPKAIFSWMAKAWMRQKGDAAYLRYPSKYPEAWELLCDQKSADLLVPAFELWIVKHALHEKIEWPLQDFIRVAEEFMSQVIPLNEARPRITKEQLAATELNALHAHCKENPGYQVIDGKLVHTEVKEEEPGPDALFGPEGTV